MYECVINTVISLFRCTCKNNHYCTLKGYCQQCVFSFKVTIQLLIQFSRPMPACSAIAQVLSSFLKSENFVSLYQTGRRGGKEENKRRTIKGLSNRNLKFLCGCIKCLSLPMHIPGPSPNGIYVYFGRLFLFSSVKRSGSNFCGSGNYVASK